MVSLKKRPLKSIKFPPQKPNKSEILTSIVVHDFLLRGLAATSRSREMIIDRWNLNDKEAHKKSPKLAFSIQSMVDWTGLDFPSGRVKKWWIESLVLACSESLSWRKSQIKLHTKMQQFMMLIFSKWFLHQSTYFPTRCYQMLSWTLNLDLYCKENKVLITTSMGLEANQPHTTSPSLPWNPCYFTARRATKPRAQDRDTPASAGGQPHFTSLASIFQGPNALRSKNWGHGATL